MPRHPLHISGEWKYMYYNSTICFKTEIKMTLIRILVVYSYLWRQSQTVRIKIIINLMHSSYGSNMVYSKKFSIHKLLLPLSRSTHRLKDIHGKLNKSVVRAYPSFLCISQLVKLNRYVPFDFHKDLKILFLYAHR